MKSFEEREPVTGVGRQPDRVYRVSDLFSSALEGLAELSDVRIEADSASYNRFADASKLEETAEKLIMRLVAASFGTASLTFETFRDKTGDYIDLVASDDNAEETLDFAVVCYRYVTEALVRDAVPAKDVGTAVTAAFQKVTAAGLL